MNKIELEKMFYDKFDINSEGTSFGMEDYTKFIFETIIPEVLKNIMPNGVCSECFNHCDMNEQILEKAKELYGIEL